MDVFEAFRKRFSYRGDFADTPVPREDLLKIADAGRVAPTARNTQLPTFVIIDDPGIIRQIAEISPQTMFRTAKAVIACVATPLEMPGGFSYHPEDGGAAVAQMLLAITALGYASVWVQGFLKNAENATKINEILNIPAGKTVQILLPMGVPLSNGAQPEKKPLETRACFNSYDL